MTPHRTASVALITLALAGTALAAPVAAQAAAVASSAAHAINNRGQVVGQYSVDSGETHAVLWEQIDGTWFGSDLGTLGGSTSTAYGINALGEVVGVSETASGAGRAFRYTATGGMTDLGALPGASECAAVDINDRSDVVGYCAVSVPGFTVPFRRAVLWTQGRVVDIDPVAAPGQSGEAYGINNRGDILALCSFGANVLVVWPGTGEGRDCVDLRVDTTDYLDATGHFGGVNDSGEVAVNAYGSGIDLHGVLWRPGGGRYQETDLGTPTIVWDINERTEVVGTNGSHGFVWVDGTMTDLGTLGGPSSIGYGINDRGQVVGNAMTASNEWHAFFWSRGTMTDLGTLDPM